MYHHFLGFKFLVRNEEKNEIPCQGTRKIQGKFKKFVRLHFYQFYPKSEEKRRTNISKKTSIFLRHNF